MHLTLSTEGYLIILNWKMRTRPDGERFLRRLKYSATTTTIPIRICSTVLPQVPEREQTLRQQGIPCARATTARETHASRPTLLAGRRTGRLDRNGRDAFRTSSPERALSACSTPAVSQRSSHRRCSGARVALRRKVPRACAGGAQWSAVVGGRRRRRRVDTGRGCRSCGPPPRGSL